MAIQLRSTPTEGTTFTGSPRTAAKPTGTVAGDLLVLCVILSAAIAPTSVPSGFTLVAASALTNTPSIYLYTKIAGGSEPDPYSVSFASGSGKIGVMALYSDVGVPLVVDVAAAQLNASGDRLWPSISPVYGNDLLACYACVTSNVATTPDAAMTERNDLSSASRLYLMTQTLVAAGATGTRTGTGTASTSAAAIIAIAEPGVHGAAAITLDALTLAAAGTVAVKGAADIVLAAVTLSATGTVPVAAGADITLAPLTLVATGKVKVQGAAGLTLAGVTLVAAGQGPPFVPTEFSAVAVSGSRIDLTWAESGPSISGFNIERSLTGVGAWSEIATVGAAVRSYADEGLAQNTEYFYRIRSRRD